MCGSDNYPRMTGEQVPLQLQRITYIVKHSPWMARGYYAASNRTQFLKVVSTFASIDRVNVCNKPSGSCSVTDFFDKLSVWIPRQ